MLWKAREKPQKPEVWAYNKKIVHTRDGGGGILEAGNEFGFTRTPNDTIQNGVPEHVEDSSR